MATCGYESIHDFQKAEIMLAPAIKTEGKGLQQAQHVGMG
jgi:IMP dehydrogenase